MYDNIVYFHSKNRIIYLQEDDLNLDTFGKKKKKKKKDRLGDADGDDADDGENKENGKFIFSFVRYPWIYRKFVGSLILTLQALCIKS